MIWFTHVNVSAYAGLEEIREKSKQEHMQMVRKRREDRKRNEERKKRGEKEKMKLQDHTAEVRT